MVIGLLGLYGVNLQEIYAREMYQTCGSSRKSGRSVTSLPNVQLFHKEFQGIESVMNGIKSHVIPNDFGALFDIFTKTRSQIGQFMSVVAKMQKKMVLQGKTDAIPYHGDIISFFANFCSFYSVLIQIDSKLGEIFYALFQKCTNAFLSPISQFAGACQSDHVSKQLYQTKESTIKQKVVKIRSLVDNITKTAVFSELNQESLSLLISEIKNLARFIETGLHVEIRSHHIILQNAESIIRCFHSEYVNLVALLNCIPKFNQDFHGLKQHVISASSYLENTAHDISIQFSFPWIPETNEINLNQSIITNRSFSENQVIPNDMISEFESLLNINVSSLNDIDKMGTILESAKSQIYDLKQQIHQQNTRLLALEEIKSDLVYQEKFEENLKYRKELEASMNREKEFFMRDLINRMGKISSCTVIHQDDPLNVQVDCIVSSIESTLCSLNKNVIENDTQIKTSKQILENFASINGLKSRNGALISEMIEDLVLFYNQMNKLYEERINSIDPSINEMKSFLIGALKGYFGYTEEKIKSLNSEQMGHALGRSILDLVEENKLKMEEIQVLKGNTNSYVSEIIVFLNLVLSKLTKINGFENSVTNILNFHEISSIIMNQFEKLESKSQDDLSLKRCLVSFLSQLLFYLNIPQIKFKDATNIQLQGVMGSIIDSPIFQSSSLVSQQIRTPSESSLRQTNGSQTPIHSPRKTSSTITTVSTDKQEILMLRESISDAIGLINNNKSLAYHNLSSDKLTEQLKQSVYSLNSTTKDIMGSLIDIYKMLNPSIQKSTLQSKHFNDIISLIIQSIEDLKKSNHLAMDHLFSFYRKICPSKVIPSNEMSIIHCIISDINNYHKCQEIIQVLTPIMNKLFEVLSGDPNLFNNNGTLIFDLVQQCESISHEVVIIPEEQRDSRFFDFLMKNNTIINSFLKLVAQKSSSGCDIQALIDDHHGVSLENRMLSFSLKEKDEIIKKLQNDISRIADLERMQTKQRIERLKAYHQLEIQTLQNYLLKEGLFRIPS